jgi:thioester reductase-like protein
VAEKSGALLLTGFPGFLGARLLPRLLETRPASHAACLVQARFLDLAR